MKKIFYTFFIFLVFLTLSGCGFFGSDELAIASITTEVKDEKLYLVITYTDEFTEPSYFELGQGKDGARGNGIAEIITDDETKPGYTLVTVKYTDTSLHDEKFELPHGVSIENVTVEAKVDAEGNPLVDENGEPTGEEELVITFTGGKETIRIPYSKPKDGREVIFQMSETHIQWKYNDGVDEWKDLISIEELKGADGNSIINIKAGESTDGSEYIVYFYFADSEVPLSISFPAAKEPAQWHTGNSYPPSNLGKVGDFYLDKTNAKIYQKQSEHNWGDAIVSFGSPNADCTVTFKVSETGSIEKGSIKGSSELTLKYGTYFYGSGMNIPTVDAFDGYNFIGWSTSENPNETNGYFTDLTPVYGDITLYAVFQEK